MRIVGNDDPRKTQMIFMEIDRSFMGKVTTIAKGRLIVDCGAGAGELQRCMPHGAVTSLDIRPQTEHVIMKDCTEWGFGRQQLPIFIRPCHGTFVEHTIRRAFELGAKECLYVGFEKNIEGDLGREYRHLDVQEELGWVGPENERIFRIRSNYGGNHIETFLKLEDKRYGFVWWARKEGDKIVNRHGGYQFLQSRIKVLEEVSAHDFDELDWSGTELIKEDSDAGWVSPDGTFYGCSSEDHDAYAQYVLKSTVESLQVNGWVRVYGEPGSSAWGSDWTKVGSLTAEQRNWLSEHGHHIGEFD